MRKQNGLYMPCIRTLTCLLIGWLLSAKINAQAISNISTKKVEIALANTPITLFKVDAASDSLRKRPFTYRDRRIAQPLFVANGRLINVKKLARIAPYRIANIEVFKGEQAIAKFGPQGKNGAIVISLKRKKWFSCN